MKFLVIDCGGLHVDTARTLAADSNEVFYFSPWYRPYPVFEDGAVGLGVEGIEKVYDWADVIDQCDCVMLPDSGMGGLGTWLRAKGYRVFSAGGMAERLEFDRAFSFEVLDQLGIKIPPTWTVVGIDNAIAKLAELMGEKPQETNQLASGNFFVKFDRFRGTQETFPAEDLDSATLRLNRLRAKVGPWASQIPITIQGSVEGIETGCDVFFNGQEFLMPGMWGFESGGSYIGYVTRDMGIFVEDLQRLAPWLAQAGYRGAFSMEAIYNPEDQRLYWIDPTPRMPMPLGLMYTVFSASWPALVYGIADGTLKESNLPEGRYIGCMEVSSAEAITNFERIGGGDDTRFLRYMEEDGALYTVPGIECIGVACGQGDSLGEVEAAIQKEAEDASVYFGAMHQTFAQDIKEKYVDPLAELGIQFGHNPVLEAARPKGVKGSRAGAFLRRWG